MMTTMPGRQIRLEADTLAKVEADQAANGGSLSAAANRVAEWDHFRTTHPNWQFAESGDVV